MEQYGERFAELVEKPIDDQAKFFLNAFVLEFKGNFEEVLDLGATFKKFAPNKGEGPNVELEEDAAHRFLEHLGETQTIVEFREKLAVIDIDNNHKVSYTEYLLSKYGKTVSELFNPPGGASPEAIAALNKAIEEYQKILEAKRAREEKMEKLAALAEKGGVKGKAAANELEQMKSEDLLEARRKEITAAAGKRKAEKAAQDGSAERAKALQEEEARLNAEKKAKEEAEKKAQDESRARLKAKAALWN
eukprot:Rmarinus@m.4232